MNTIANEAVKIILEKVKRTDPRYQDIRNRHYVANRGCHGQQMHYLVLLEKRVVGIISGASSVYAVKSRDEFFGLTSDNKRVALNCIVNNVVFRLEEHLPNLGTQVLSMWRKQIAIDWESKYGVRVHGFETFVVEEEWRKGSMYRADNWQAVGITVGSTKVHKGLNTPHTRVATTPKLVFCRKVPRTKLCTKYTSTWRGKLAE